MLLECNTGFALPMAVRRTCAPRSPSHPRPRFDRSSGKANPDAVNGLGNGLSALERTSAETANSSSAPLRTWESMSGIGAKGAAWKKLQLYLFRRWSCLDALRGPCAHRDDHRMGGGVVVAKT